MTTEKTLRNSNIELLRFILMFAICVWHMFVHGFDIKNIANGNIDLNYAHLACCSILVPTVNCFMLISGYYGIKCNARKIISFVFQASFYFWLCMILKFIFWKNLEFNNIIHHILPISTYTWWFLTIYFIILLLSPIINTGIKNLSKKQYLIILGALIFINSVGLYINQVSLGSNLLSLFILYLLGRFLTLHKIHINRQKAFLIWMTSTIFLILCIECSTRISLKITWLLFSYNNILIILQAIGILYFALSFKARHNKFFLYLGANSFAIYLLTEGLGMKLYTLWSNIYTSNIILALFAILITCLLITAINSLQLKINHYICNIFNRRLNDKNNNLFV